MGCSSSALRIAHIALRIGIVYPPLRPSPASNPQRRARYPGRWSSPCAPKPPMTIPTARGESRRTAKCATSLIPGHAKRLLLWTGVSRLSFSWLDYGGESDFASMLDVYSALAPQRFGAAAQLRSYRPPTTLNRSATPAILGGYNPILLYGG
jgi:hypothetical protein